MLRWGKFFAAETDEELEQLALLDPEMGRAKSALDRLSADPAARELARERELAAWNYERTLRLARREGIEEGRREGIEEGRCDLLLRLLELKFGPLPESASQRVRAATSAEIDLWGARVLTASTLDEVLVA